MTALLEEPLSPELVLVSPPDVVERALEGLPDYDHEFAEWIVHVRALFEAAEQEERRRGRRATLGAISITMLLVLDALAPLVLLVLFARP